MTDGSIGFVLSAGPFLKFSMRITVVILVLCFLYSLIHKIYFKGKREYDPKFKKSNKKKIPSKFRFFEIMERELDPGTEYTVYMRASTSNGEGNRSDSIIINTPAKGECRSVNLIVNLHIALFPFSFF